MCRSPARPVSASMAVRLEINDATRRHDATNESPQAPYRLPTVRVQICATVLTYICFREHCPCCKRASTTSSRPFVAFSTSHFSSFLRFSPPRAFKTCLLIVYTMWLLLLIRVLLGTPAIFNSEEWVQLVDRSGDSASQQQPLPPISQSWKDPKTGTQLDTSQ